MKSSAKAAAAARPPEAGPVGDFWLRIYSGAFGAFLGLAIVKFGNPVILDEKIIPPTSLSDAWISPWPTHWANLLLVLIALPGLWLAFTHWRGGLGLRALWILPVAWLGWQVVSATQTVDGALTATTLWQLAGCVGCYFLGALVLS